MTLLRVRLILSAVCTLAVVWACSPGYEGASSVSELPGDGGLSERFLQFAPVVTPLVYFCGSIDCHGATGRNLRLYGLQGRRLDPNDVPCNLKELTTSAEVEADFRSVVGLEPEVLAAVVADGGKHPERLTLIRKARGTEQHTGGQVFPEGSAGDQCLVDWIAGKTSEVTAACNNPFPQNPRPQCVP